MDEAVLSKGGEIKIITTLHRTKNGLGIVVHADASIEDFFRTWSAGVEAVAMYGRHWTAPKDEPFEVYSIANIPPPQMTEDGYLYTMASVGQPLIHLDEGRRTVVNISFLRLRGISAGNGIRFTIPGTVISAEGINSLANQIQAAQRAFYISYMKPIQVSFVTSIQEIRA